MKLYKGDCLEVMRDKIPDASVDLVLTDPPYGTTRCSWDAVIPIPEMWEQIWRVIKPKRAVVLFAAQPFTTVLINSQMDLFKYNWTWDKGWGTGHLNAKHAPMRCTEDVCVFGKEKILYNPQMDTRQESIKRKGYGNSSTYGKEKETPTKLYVEKFPSTILYFNRPANSVTIHPTQKPVALMEYLIRTYTNPGDTVLDFTMGSGTTGVACVKTDRKFIGIEKSGKYFKIAKQRIEKTTGPLF